MSGSQETQIVDINEFADMVGFPAELIKKELFTGDSEKSEVTMEELRSVMLQYLNKNMLGDNQ